MTKRQLFACFLCVIVLVAGISNPVLGEEVLQDPSVVNGCHSPDAALTLLGEEKIAAKAQAVFAYEIVSDTLLYCREADKQIYPASFVKLMTALLVLENGKLSDVVTVQQSTLDTLDQSAISVDLQAGEQITVENLLYCMLVASANDAAAVLAEYVSGSQEQFVNQMNDRAAALGCTGTFYTNVHGLHNDQQLSTARDTCKILRQALCHNEFRIMFGTVHYAVPETNLNKARNLTTNNYLMCTDTVGIHFDNRVKGGRTGLTTEGYQNVATISECGNMEVICIIMEASSTFADNGSVKSFGGFPETTEVLNLVSEGYSRRQIIFQDEVLRQQTVINGDCDVFAASKEGFYTVLPDSVAIDQLVFRYTDAVGSNQAPISRGQNLASLQVWYGNMCIGTTDVYAMNRVSVAESKVITIGEKESNGFPVGSVILGIVIVISVFSAVLIIMRYHAIARHNRKKHRRRK